jgi:hypothetical protein
VHLLNSEEVRGDELSDLPPVLAIGREGDIGGPVQEVVADHGRGPRREHVVVRAQDRLRGPRG